MASSGADISKRIYFINTINKDSGTNEHFSYTLQIPESEGYDRVVLLQASIPNTFYIVQNNYNTFILKEGVVETTITVPPGNYTAKVFALVVSALLTANSPNGWIYTVALPNQMVEASTGMFTYSVTGNSSQPSIIVTDTVNEQLGFHINTTNTFVANKLVSATVVNFTAESTLYILSDIVDGRDNNVLQEIYVANTISLSYITYLCVTPDLYSKVLKTNKSNTFQFSLTNEKKQLLDLHGVNMQLTLCLYQSNNTDEIIRKYIRLKLKVDSSGK